MSTKQEAGPDPHILIIDQFEELFSTHHQAWKKREDFFQQLAQAMQADPYMWVVLVMREDYIALLDAYDHLVPGRFRSRYYMQRLERDAALDAIKKPVMDLRPYAESVAEKLVDDLCSVRIYKPDGSLDVVLGQYVEPVQLQVVCSSLWEKLPPGNTQITEEDWRIYLGDVNQTLGDYYERRIKAVAEGEESQKKRVKERDIREWFERKLITADGIRNLVTQEPGRKSGGLDDDVAQEFVKRGDLVRADTRGGTTFYELTHDRLVEPIRGNNKKWNKKNSSPFRQQAEAWKESAEKEIYLLNAQALAEAENWAENYQDKLNEIDREFLEACRVKQAEKVRLAREQSAKRQRLLLFVVSIAFVISVILGSVSVYQYLNARQATSLAEDYLDEVKAQKQEADTQRAEAIRTANLARAGRLATQSQFILESDPRLSLLLSIESLKLAERGEKTYFPETEEVLRRAIDEIGKGIPLIGHYGNPKVAFSPNKRWLATASDESIRLWDLNEDDPSLNPITLVEFNYGIHGLAFSEDGHWLASGGNDGAIWLWEMTGDDIPAEFKQLNGHQSWVTSIAFSPDGQWLASGSDDSTIRLWDITSDALSDNSRELTGHTSSITTIAFSNDGTWLASGSDDSTIRLWNITSNDPSANSRELTGHTGSVTSIAFSKDGAWLASGSDDSTVRLWDMKSKNPSTNSRELSGHGGRVTSIAFSPDGAWLANGNYDSTIRLWDMKSKDPSASSRELSGHNGRVTSIAFSLDGDWLISGSSDSTVRLWNMTVENPSTNSKVLVGHKDWVTSIALSIDGHWLASGSYDSTVRLWDIKNEIDSKVEDEMSSFDPIASLISSKGNTINIIALAFSPEEKWLVSSSEDSTVRLWDFETGIPQDSIVISDDNLGTINAILFLDNKTFIGEGENKALIKWDASTGSIVEDIPTELEESNISTIALSSQSILAMADDRNHVVDLYKGGDVNVKDYIVTLDNNGETIDSLAFSPDGKWLASGNADSSISLWNVENISALEQLEKPLAELSEHMENVYKVVFSPEGNWLASASADSTVRIWDFREGVPKDATFVLHGHKGPVYSLAFSPKGRWLASAGEDGAIRLWDMSAVKPSIRFISLPLNGITSPIKTIIFSPKGRWLVAGTQSSDILILGVGLESLIKDACKLASRNMTWQEAKEYLQENEEYKEDPYHYKTCLDLVIHPSIAINLRDEGDQLANNGNLQGAITQYRQAQEIDPEIDLSVNSSDEGDLGEPESRAKEIYTQYLISEGDKLAKEGKVAAAIKKYNEALRNEPSISDSLGNSEEWAKSLATEALIEAGDQLAVRGNVKDAITKFKRALEIDPSISEELGDPESRAKRKAAQPYIDLGDELARSDDIEGAVEKYREALLKYPVVKEELDDPESRAKELAAMSLIYSGDKLALKNDIEGAVEKYRKALTKASSVDAEIADPETRANEIATDLPEIYRTIDSREFQPDYQKASRKLTALLEKYPNLKNTIDVDRINLLCWFGSLYGYAIDVKNACELLGELDNENGNHRDSRGVNRGILGDYQGAIEDLEYAVKWFSESASFAYKSRVKKREAWLVLLKANENPFDMETLDALKDE